MNKQHLILAMESRHNIECSECHKHFASNSNYTRHIREVHSNIRFCRRCPVFGCSKTFLRRCYLVKHLKSVHKFSADVAKLKALEVTPISLTREQYNTKKQEQRFNVVRVDGYSDISDDEQDSTRVYGNVPSFDMNTFLEECLQQTESTEPYVYSDVPFEVRDPQNDQMVEELLENNFDNWDANSIYISDDELQDLLAESDSDPKLPAESDNPKLPPESDNEPSVITVNTSAITLTLYKRTIAYSDGRTETERETQVGYSEI